MNTARYNVVEFDASPDGKKKNTREIQRAIDACHASGGGVIYFPPGVYSSGTLFLKSNVTLYLEAGATLLGSRDMKDYFPKATARYAESAYGYLLYGENLENVSLAGRGVIDGSGGAFWTNQMINPHVWKPKASRPLGLILLKNCTNTLVRDITLRNSPRFTLWLMGCDIATISAVRVINPRKGPNTDALDIDGCSNVHISDCHLDAGDDCIAVKSDAILLGRNKACENIVVTNCTMASTACAIRVGYEGDSPIRNCTFSNLVIHDADIGIDVVSILPASAPNIKRGAEIDGILFHNIMMDNVSRPIFMWLGRERKGKCTCRIKNVSISNMIANARNGCYLGGCSGRPLEGISLRDIKLIPQGKMTETQAGVPNVWGGEPTPWAFDCRHIQGLKFDHIEVDWTKATGAWKGSMNLEQVSHLKINDFEG